MISGLPFKSVASGGLTILLYPIAFWCGPIGPIHFIVSRPWISD